MPAKAKSPLASDSLVAGGVKAGRGRGRKERPYE